MKTPKEKKIELSSPDSVWGGGGRVETLAEFASFPPPDCRDIAF